MGKQSRTKSDKTDRCIVAYDGEYIYFRWIECFVLLVYLMIRNVPNTVYQYNNNADRNDRKRQWDEQVELEFVGLFC